MKDIMDELREKEAKLLVLTAGLEDLARRHEKHGDKLGFARAVRAILNHANSLGETQEFEVVPVADMR